MTADLDDLIRQSASENLGEDDGAVSAGEDTGSSALLNHPWVVLFAWLFCASLILYYHLEPLPKQHDLGVRSVETRLGIAVYHVAHRVESYRQQTGHLPDYLLDEWQESSTVSFEPGEKGYVIYGRMGELEIVYHEGDDPEPLINGASSSGRQD